MKTLFTIILSSVISLTCLSKNDSLSFRFAKLKTEFNNSKFNMFVDNKQHQVNLHLNLVSSKDRFDPNYSASGVALLLGGIAFTTASLLEGGSQYGTYQPGTFANGANTTYVIPPFYQQQPRFTMFLVGVGLSLGGFGLMVN